MRIPACREERYGGEPFPLISQSLLLNLSQMCCLPTDVFHSQPSSAQADRHPGEERLNQPLRLYDFLSNRCLHRIEKGGDVMEDAIRGNRFFFYSACGVTWIVHTNPWGFDPSIVTIAYEVTLHQRLAPDRFQIEFFPPPSRHCCHSCKRVLWWV